MHVYLSNSTDIFTHLAREEYLLNNLSPEQRILYIWKSHDAIVIGKNQNPWKECLVNDAREKDISIARRLSGGGTVFHDEGNLNFSFISYQHNYNFDSQINVIKKALRHFALQLKLQKNNILTMNGKKCSGNAFCHRKNRSLHHGTLLINSKLDRINHYLQPSINSIKTYAIESNPYPIINLTKLNDSLTFDKVAEQIIAEFCKSDSSPEIHYVDKEGVGDSSLNILSQKYRSKDWIFNETPRFVMSLRKCFSWGIFDTEIQFNKGQVVTIKIDSAGLDKHVIKTMEETLTHLPFDSNKLSNALSAMKTPIDYQSHVSDISRYIKLNPF